MFAKKEGKNKKFDMLLSLKESIRYEIDIIKTSVACLKFQIFDSSSPWLF